MYRVLIVASALAAGPAAGPVLAQGNAEDARIRALVLPMLEGLPLNQSLTVSPEMAAVMTECVIALADPSEKAALAAASAPSAEVQTLLPAILGRPATSDCILRTLGG